MKATSKMILLFVSLTILLACAMVMARARR
jgi:hypothetical protein